MRAISYRCLLAVLAAVLGGVLASGCDEGNEWEHPNRERYAAPPPEESTTRSLSELQREWRQQDRRQARGDDAQQDSAEQEQTRTVLDDAAQYIREALEAAISESGAPADGQDTAVGGGPPEQASPTQRQPAPDQPAPDQPAPDQPVSDQQDPGGM